MWRGSRGRHIYALMLSLKALHAVEQAAALKIQTKWRTYKARMFLRLLKQLQVCACVLSSTFACSPASRSPRCCAQAEQMFRERMATQIQKVFRGLKGRQIAEITKNIKVLTRLAHAVCSPPLHPLLTPGLGFGVGFDDRKCAAFLHRFNATLRFWTTKSAACGASTKKWNTASR